MITTLAQLTATVQEAEAEGWALDVDWCGKPKEWTSSGLDRMVHFDRGDDQLSIAIAPWVDPAKMVRRTGR